MRSIIHPDYWKDVLAVYNYKRDNISVKSANAFATKERRMRQEVFADPHSGSELSTHSYYSKFPELGRIRGNSSGKPLLFTVYHLPDGDVEVNVLLSVRPDRMDYHVTVDMLQSRRGYRG